MSGRKTPLNSRAQRRELLFSPAVFDQSSFNKQKFKEQYNQAEELLKLDELARMLQLKVNTNLYLTTKKKLKDLLLRKALRPIEKNSHELYNWNESDLISLAQRLHISFNEIENHSIDTASDMKKCIREIFKKNVNICMELIKERQDVDLCGSDSEPSPGATRKKPRVCQE